MSSFTNIIVAHDHMRHGVEKKYERFAWGQLSGNRNYR